MNAFNEYKSELIALKAQVEAGRLSITQAEALGFVSAVKYHLAEYEMYKRAGDLKTARELLHSANNSNDLVRQSLLDKSLGLDKIVNVQEVIRICEQAVERAYEQEEKP